METTFENENQSSRPPSCLFFSAMLSIPYGKFVFVKYGEEKDKETVEFGYDRFYLDINKS